MSDIFDSVNLPGPISTVLTNPALSGISLSGDTVGVLGKSVSQAGVSGSSKTGDGVDGSSDSGVGVRGTSNSQSGVAAQSQSADGVWAVGGNNGVYGKTSNDKASGVFGINLGKGPGVSAASQHGPSLIATGYNGNLAGEFDGNVTVTGDATVSTLTSTGKITSKDDVSAGSFTTSGNVSAHDVLLSGQDIAEEFSVGSAEWVEPGTVMVIGDEEGNLSQCAAGYDRKVAGVISGAGDLKPGVVLGQRAGELRTSPLAMVGKVYCKVDATYAPILIGDLLTTSPTPGHAMKANDPSRAFGSVVGKALRQLDSGVGLIPVLIALQ